MAYLTAAAVVVGIIAALNLLLTFGVIRRLRDHTDRLNRLQAVTVPRPTDLILPVGDRPGTFETETVDGRPISAEQLDSGTIVGFFSAHCGPCEHLVPRFATAATALDGTAPADPAGPAGPAGQSRPDGSGNGRVRALAVLLESPPPGPGEPPDVLTVEKVAILRSVAHVVIEPATGPVHRAFSARGYPAMCRLGAEGRIETTTAEDVLESA